VGVAARFLCGPQKVKNTKVGKPEAPTWPRVMRNGNKYKLVNGQLPGFLANILLITHSHTGDFCVGGKLRKRMLNSSFKAESH